MKKYAAIIVENRLTNDLFDTIQAHRQMLPPWWSCCHIDDPMIKTPAFYNNLLTSKGFWERFKKFDRVLIFQWDSKLLRPGIEDFIKWDFIGAPIKHIEGCMNGGLSLRNPKKMLKVIEKFPYRGMVLDGNEDIYFVNRLSEMKTKMPTVEEASKFSVETVFALGSLGCHAQEKYLTAEENQQVLNQYK